MSLRHSRSCYTDNHGLEIALTRRMAGKWMGRLSLAFNNAREHFDDPNGVYVAPYGIELAASVFGRQGYPSRCSVPARRPRPDRIRR